MVLNKEVQEAAEQKTFLVFQDLMKFSKSLLEEWATSHVISLEKPKAIQEEPKDSRMISKKMSCDQSKALPEMLVLALMACQQLLKSEKVWVVSLEES